MFSISLPLFGLFVALGFVGASFVLWRSLREDYPEEEIITLTLWLSLVALVFGRVFYLLSHFPEFNFEVGKWIFWTRFPGFSLSGAFLGGVIFSFYFSQRRNWDFWVLADSATLAWLTAFLLGTFGALLSSGERLFLLNLLLVIFVFLLSLFFGRQFRKFIWYKSGKPGFAACAATFFYFLGMALLDFFQQTGVSFEVGGGLLIALGSLVFLYRRSERSLKEDVVSLGQTLLRRLKR